MRSRQKDVILGLTLLLIIFIWFGLVHEGVLITFPEPKGFDPLDGWSTNSTKDRIKDYCKREEKRMLKSLDSSPSKVRTLKFLVDTPKKLAYCHVPKVATTFWFLAFADIMDIDKELLEKWKRKGRMHDEMLRPEYALVGDAINQTGRFSLPGTFKFTFLRHPFSRLSSAYHDKFVTAFNKDKFIQSAMPFFKARDYFAKTSGNKTITFPMFVDLVLYEVTTKHFSIGSLHWWPYTELCALCLVDYDFYGHQENFVEDTKHLLNEFPAYDKFQLNAKRLGEKFNAQGSHSESMALDYFAQVPKDKIRQLHELYTDDFFIGGYAYPQDYVDVGL